MRQRGMPRSHDRGARRPQDRVLGTAAAAAVGAGLMYALDPRQGRRRRTVARDKGLRLARRARRELDTAGRDARNRTVGVVAETRGRLGREEVPDDVLVQRVRSAAGRLVSHPGAIEVGAADGRVTVSGPILTHERRELVEGVGKVRGVVDVDDRLEPHDEPGDVPGLQGAPAARGRGLRRRSWPPVQRTAAAAAGGALAVGGLRRGGPLGAAAAAAGGALAARGIANVELRRLVGLSPAEEADGGRGGS